MTAVATRRRGPSREVAVALAVKLALLVVLYFVSFDATEHPRPSAQATATALLGSTLAEARQ